MGNRGSKWTAERRQKLMAQSGSPSERFYRNIEYDTNGGCWLWNGTIITGTGYGQIQIDGRAISAHRLAYSLFREESGELFVCHRCDVRACVNPAHLFLGTHAENLADMVTKGRSARGERNRRAKLTATDIPTIFALRAAGSSQRDIGDRYGVSQVKISQILLGKAWAHIAGERPSGPPAGGLTRDRLRRGESHPSTTLTNEQVIAIRSDSRTPTALGRLYGVSRPTISRIQAGKTWGHLSDPQSANERRLDRV